MPDVHHRRRPAGRHEFPLPCARPASRRLRGQAVHAGAEGLHGSRAAVGRVRAALRRAVRRRRRADRARREDQLLPRERGGLRADPPPPARCPHALRRARAGRPRLLELPVDEEERPREPRVRGGGAAGGPPAESAAARARLRAALRLPAARPVRRLRRAVVGGARPDARAVRALRGPRDEAGARAGAHPGVHRCQAGPTGRRGPRRQTLRERMAPAVWRFAALTGLDVGAWGYPA